MISFVSHGAGILTIMEASAEHDCCSEAQRNARRTGTSYFVCTVFLFHYIKWLPCERTLISALQALKKHHRICDTTFVKLRLNCFQFIFVGAESDFDCVLNTTLPLGIRMCHMEVIMITFLMMLMCMRNILSKNTALYW